MDTPAILSSCARPRGASCLLLPLPAATRRHPPRSLAASEPAQFMLPFLDETTVLTDEDHSVCEAPKQRGQTARKSRSSVPSRSLPRKVPRQSQDTETHSKQTQAAQSLGSTRPPSVSDPSRQFIPKKLPQSQESAEDRLSTSEGSLEDLSFLRLPEVKAVTGLGKTSIYELIREKSFPAPVRVGPRAVGWVRSEVRQWAAERVHASRSAA